MNHTVINTTVFARSEGGGNPCPVILDADHLSTENMQKMTHGFGHESAFVLKPTRSDCDIRLRYFVPLHEMQMCVHATVGSITVLVNRGILKESPATVETMAGPVRVEWQTNGSELDVSVEQFPPEFLETAPPLDEVCRALNIRPDDIMELPIQSVATSRYKLMVPLKSVDVLNSLNPDFEYLWKICDQNNITGFYPFAIEDSNGNRVQARQFPNRAGYNEDPATGVAASALGAYLAKNECFSPLKEGWNSYQVIQGIAMGRPSVIQSEVFVHNDRISRTRVKGNAFLV